MKVNLDALYEVNEPWTLKPVAADEQVIHRKMMFLNDMGMIAMVHGYQISESALGCDDSLATEIVTLKRIGEIVGAYGTKSYWATEHLIADYVASSKALNFAHYSSRGSLSPVHQDELNMFEGYFGEEFFVAYQAGYVLFINPTGFGEWCVTDTQQLYREHNAVFEKRT